MPVKNKEKTYEKIIELSKNDDYTTSNLLDYEHFLKYYKLIDLSKQTELENLKLKQQTNFIGKLEEDEAKNKITQKSHKIVTQKIINLPNDSNNEETKFATKNGMLLTIKQQKVNTTKTILLNLKQKTLNQAF